MHINSQKQFENGFTLIEVIVSISIVVVLCASAYGLYTAVYNAITYYRKQTTVSAIANQYLEVARNLPYSSVGTLNGNPHGDLPDQPNALSISFNGLNYEVYYVVNALHDPADPNPMIQDYKQVKLYVKDVAANTTKSFVATIAPINLASMGSGGALSIHVISSIYSDWEDVAGATINIINTSITPNINLTRTADATGKWNEIGLPADGNYQIKVSKAGYSSEQTYSTTEYPNATQPNVAVIEGDTQSVTLMIDKLSKLNFFAKNQTCQVMPSVAMNVEGSKLISPTVLKFDEDFSSDSSGLVSPTTTSSCSSTCGSSSCCLEWDTYVPKLTGNDYMIYGTSPVQSADVSPDSTQNFTLILGAKNPYSELVVVKDTSAEGDLIEGVTVRLTNTGFGYDETKYTGGSVWSQEDWSGGSGQASFTIIEPNRYYLDDGHITTGESPIAVRLAKDANDDYYSSGWLISSTFDTGTEATSYTLFDWDATQDPEFSVKFQIATSNDPHDGLEDTFWTDSANYTGIDGTSSTYYENPNSINAVNNSKRYVRYKVFLATTNTEKTPQLTGISLNYVSGCPTPGQVIFTGLTANSNYTVTVSKSGYDALDPINPVIINDDDCENGYCVLQVYLIKSS